MSTQRLMGKGNAVLAHLLSLSLFGSTFYVFQRFKENLGSDPSV